MLIPVKEFIVKRSEWYRGRGAAHSELLNHSGLKCCVGFFALACGAKSEDILTKRIIGIDSHTVYSDVAATLEGLEEVGRRIHRETNIYTTNDDIGMSDYEREIKLAGMFSELGINISFVA